MGADTPIRNFEARYKTLLWRARLVQLAGAALTLALLFASAYVAEVDLDKLISGWPQLSLFFAEFLPNITTQSAFADVKTDGSFAFWFYGAGKWAHAILTSVNMAVLATLMSVATGLGLALIAARNMGAPVWLSFGVRRFLELLRTIPDLVLALIFVFAFGVGPFAGLLAIWLHATGALGKLYAEVIENIAMNQVDGMRGAGASWLQIARFGVIPQILPNVASYGLVRFEVNVGAAAAIGFVGGGGIGQEFITAMQFGSFRDASAILAMIIAVIFVIDLTSERIRGRLSGEGVRA